MLSQSVKRLLPEHCDDGPAKFGNRQYSRECSALATRRCEMTQLRLETGRPIRVLRLPRERALIAPFSALRSSCLSTERKSVLSSSTSAGRSS